MVYGVKETTGSSKEKSGQFDHAADHFLGFSLVVMVAPQLRRIAGSHIKQVRERRHRWISSLTCTPQVELFLK